MTISKDKNRKEVHLTQDVLNILQRKADEDGRSLKNLMETILIKYAKQINSTPNSKEIPIKWKNTDII